MKKSSKCSKKISNYLGIKYVAEWRNIRYPRLEYSTPVLHLILPFHMKNEKTILERKKTWLLSQQARIDEALRSHALCVKKFYILGKPWQKRIMNFETATRQFRAMLRKVVKPKILVFSEELGVKVERIYIKSQKTKWASCSSRRNLSLNLKMLALPEPLIDYLLYHELIHIKEKSHNRNFVRMLRNKFPDFVNLEKELFAYWFVLEANKTWKKLLKRNCT